MFRVHEGVLPVNEGPISLGELATAASQLKMGKACGIDSIPPELLRLTGIQEALLPMLNQVFETNARRMESIWHYPYLQERGCFSV